MDSYVLPLLCLAALRPVLLRSRRRWSHSNPMGLILLQSLLSFNVIENFKSSSFSGTSLRPINI
jgi:hypothetical protein